MIFSCKSFAFSAGMTQSQYIVPISSQSPQILLVSWSRRLSLNLPAANTASIWIENTGDVLRLCLTEWKNLTPLS